MSSTGWVVFCLLAASLRAEIRGTVASSEGGMPLQSVIVFLSETDHRTQTDQSGRFSLPAVAPGDYLLVATAIGFGLVKKPIRVESGEDLEVEVLLSPGTRIRDEVQVTASAEAPGPALSGREVLQLKTILTDDPVRAVQQLPGLVSNDDFNSGFAFQGSGFDRVGIFLDGAPVYVFLHSIEGEEDSGSTSLLSADLIDDVELVPGGTSAEWGATSAGFLRLTSRSPAASSRRSLVSISGSAAMGLVEGRSAGTAWLVTARQSYVDWIVQRIDPGIELNFGFHDAFGKFEVTGQKDTLMLSFLHGRTGLSNAREEVGINSIDRGRLQSDVVHLRWTRAFSERMDMDTHLVWQRGHSRNHNREGHLLWDNRIEVLGTRSAWRFRPHRNWLFSSGLTAEQWGDRAGNRVSKAEAVPGFLFPISTNRRPGWKPSWNPPGRLSRR